MRCAKCRHNAQKRTSGCRASGRHISIPIHRISFVDTQERVRIRRFTLTMYAQKNSRTNGGETFRRRMNFSKNRNLTATRAFRFPLFAQRFQRAQDKASNKTARFLKNADTLLKNGKNDFFSLRFHSRSACDGENRPLSPPFAAVWGYLRRSLAKIQRKTRKNHA